MAFVRRIVSLSRKKSNICSVRHIFQTGRLNSTQDSNDVNSVQSVAEIPPVTTESDKRLGFGKAFQKFSEITDDLKNVRPEPEQSFASMLRHSRFMQVYFLLNIIFQLQ